MRKLAIAAFSFSAAVFLANYLVAPSWLLVCAAVPVVFAFVLMLKRRKWLKPIVISLFALAFGFACFYLHYCRTTVRARALDGQTLEISAKLLEYPAEYENYCRVRVKILNEELPQFEAVVYDGEKELLNAQPGQRIRLTAKLASADVRHGQDYDYYNSRNIYLTMSAKSEISLSAPEFDLSVVPARLNRYIAELIESIFPADTRAFMKSLLLGDKTDFYKDEALSLAMSRAGFMHIVAVSGMHIAFLVGLIQMLFGNTRRSSIVCIAIVWLFVFITAKSPSAVRAAVMQTLLLIAPIVRREDDKASSLATALGLILLQNPHAAASIGLQLSFAAMAGLFLFSERINNYILSPLKSEKLKSWLSAPAAVISSSLAALVFTVPLCAVHFGYVALLSPITNMLGLWAVSLCFCGGVIACVLGAAALPAGIAAAWLASWFARYIILVAKLISSISFAVVYMSNGYGAWWVCLCYAMFAVAIFGKLRPALKILLPAGLSIATLFVFTLCAKLSYSSGTGVITVIDIGQGQSISVFSGDKTMLIDCGGLGTLDNAGETAGAYLKSCGRERVDVLLLTHLHSDHANGVTMLMEMLEISMIIMPENPEDDDLLLGGILESAARHGTELVYLTEDTQLSLGGISALLFAPDTAGDKNERCIMARLSLGDYDMLVTGDSPKEEELRFIAGHDSSGIELLVAGHHGSRYSSAGEFLAAVGAETAIISVGYNTNGHPAQEVLERLDAYGYTVYRTDLNGTIEIRIGNNYG